MSPAGLAVLGSPGYFHPNALGVQTSRLTCRCCDPYERICFFSHIIPGCCFLAGTILILARALHESKTLAGFLGCAACTHIISAVTHVWPDSMHLEKVDHVGIVALVTGTPITALLAVKNGQIPEGFMVVGGIMFAAAFLPRALRVIGFASGIAVSVFLHPEMLTWLLAVEMSLYVLGAIAFLRNAGQTRWPGFADHHFLHYFVTIACILHIIYIRRAMEASSRHIAPSPSAR
ncbi:hypothetical protein WJX74_008816 [Apatococcus lobatus]|uniref:Hemolysin III n=1 Tax=Apatococcus lobatus TaxID=904363 RepID=A0AAW1S5Q8_9CHLO